METEVRSINQEQIGGIIRQLILVLSGYAAGRKWIGEDTVQLLVSLAPIVAVVAWGWWARSDKSLIKSAADVPMVTNVVVPAPVMAESASLTEHPKVTTF
jgi:hypothetical protein